MDRLKEIMIRESKATPGKWTYNKNSLAWAPEIKNNTRNIAKILYHMGSEDNEVMSNAEFIAHSRDDIPWMITEIIKLRNELFEYKKKMRDDKMFKIGDLIQTISDAIIPNSEGIIVGYATDDYHNTEEFYIVDFGDELGTCTVHQDHMSLVLF